MGFSHKNRFLKKYDLPYYVRLNVKQVSEMSGIDLSVLQEIYDKDYAVNKRDAIAMLSVYSYCNGGKVWKTIQKEKERTFKSADLSSINNTNE